MYNQIVLNCHSSQKLKANQSLKYTTVMLTHLDSHDVTAKQLLTVGMIDMHMHNIKKILLNSRATP